MILLDTHVLLWAMDNSPRLGRTARKLMKAEVDPINISVASIWELGIKRGRGGIELPDNFLEEVEASGFQILPASAALFWDSGQLPRHHGDLFDRLIIAQALQASMAVITVDSVFAAYGVKLIDASR